MRLWLALLPMSCATAGVYYSVNLPLGGSDTVVTAMTADQNGNVYLAGATASASFPATPGVVQPVFGGGVCTYGIVGGSPFAPQQYFLCTDAFVVKLDANGNVVFATFLGGSGQDRATSIAVDGAGNIYVAGINGSTNFPRADGAVYGGSAPTFLVKLNPTGTALLYSAFLPGTGPQMFLAPFQANVPVPSVNIAMTVDAEGNAYFAANGTPGFPITDGALQSSGSMAIGKLDPTGSSLLYGTYLDSGTRYAPLGGLGVDANGNVYIAGNGGYIAKLDASGAVLDYVTSIETGSYPHPSQVRVDSAGEAYVFGQTALAAKPLFLTKLATDGTAAAYSIAPQFTGTAAFDIDSDGNAYVAAGGQTVTITRIGPDGTATGSAGLASPGPVFALAALADGSVAVCGSGTSGFFVTRLKVE